MLGEMDEVEGGVRLVVLLELQIHLLDLSPQISNLAFSRFDLPLQLLNFVIKHELELLELLVLLLQVKNALFFVRYGFVPARRIAVARRGPNGLKLEK